MQTVSSSVAGVDFNMIAGGQLVVGALPRAINRESPFEGGTTLARATNNVVLSAASVEMRTEAANGDVFVSSETGNVVFNGDVIINDDGVMKIPRHLIPDDRSTAAGGDPCVRGSIFWYDRLQNDAIAGFAGLNTDGWLCVCDENLQMNCARFTEPPCAGAGGGSGVNCPANRRF